jgi:hypothetical protein
MKNNLKSFFLGFSIILLGFALEGCNKEEKKLGHLHPDVIPSEEDFFVEIMKREFDPQKQNLIKKWVLENRALPPSGNLSETGMDYMRIREKAKEMCKGFVSGLANRSSAKIFYPLTLSFPYLKLFPSKSRLLSICRMAGRRCHSLKGYQWTSRFKLHNRDSRKLNQ